MKKQTRTSTRPDCPVCKQETLTGEIFPQNYSQDYFVKTLCQNPLCKASVFLDKQLNVYRAERRYNKNGDLT